MKDVSFSLGIVGFFVVGYFVIVGTSNAVNLTDGLDGLAIMPAVLIGGGLAVYAYLSGHVVFSDYLGLPHLPGTNELVIFCAALIGSGLAFYGLTPIRRKFSWRYRLIGHWRVLRAPSPLWCAKKWCFLL